MSAIVSLPSCSLYHVLKTLRCIADLKPRLSDTAGMEGKFPRSVTRQDSESTRQDPEKNLIEDGPMKPAAMGAHSESSTPRVASTPRGSEAPSIPTHVSDVSKSLARIFGVYAKGIVSITQSMSQNKAAKTRFRRSRKADEKWHGRYGDFAALEEMQSKSLVSSENKSKKCETALDAVKKSHKHASTQIASILAQSAHSTPPSRSSELQGAKVVTEVEGSSSAIVKADVIRLRKDFERLGNEFERLGGEFEKLQTHAQTSDVVGKQQRLEREFNESQFRLKDLEDRMHKVSVDIRDKISFSAVRAYDQDSAKLTVRVSKIEAIVAKLEKPGERVEAVNEKFDTAAYANRIDGLQAKIELLEKTMLDDRVQALESKTEKLELKKYDVEQARVDNEAVKKDISSLQALKTTSETTDMQITELKKGLSEQTDHIRSLTEAVHGGSDSNEASLLDIIRDLQNDGNKFRTMFSTLNTTIDEHQATIESLKARLKGFKDKLATSSSNPTSSGTDLQRALSDIHELKVDIARIDNEQELKDDLVSKDVNILDGRVIGQGDLLNILCERVSEMESRIATPEDEPLSKGQSSQQINERLDEIGQRLTKQDESNSKHREGIQAQLQELSSKAIALQYPSDDIQRLENLTKQHRGILNDLIAKTNNFSSPADTSHSATQSPHLTNGVVGVKEANVLKIETLESEHKAIKQEVDGLQSKFKSFEESTTDTTNNHETFIDTLRQRFDNLTTDHMVRQMIYHLQAIWPNHPANVLNQLTHVHQRLRTLDAQAEAQRTQLRNVDTQTEAQSHRIHLLGTEQKNLKDFQKRMEEQHALQQQANAESQRRDTEQLDLIEQAKIQSQQRDRENFTMLQTAKEDFHRQHAELSQLLVECKQDFQQQNKVLGEETQEKYTILEQDVRDHLGRIQNLQKGLQSIRTDHTTSVADLSKALKDAQFDIQNLGANHTNGTTNNNAELDPIKASLDKTHQRLDDVWTNFVKEMSSTHSNFAVVNKNIDTLNKYCGVEGINSPATATSHAGTPFTTPVRNANDTTVIEIEDEDDLSPTPNPKGRFDSLRHSSPAQQLTVRGGSMSLGQPSSSPREPAPASQQPTPRPDDASSDSEPILRTLKRRRGRPSKERAENTPRGRKSTRIC